MRERSLFDMLLPGSEKPCRSPIIPAVPEPPSLAGLAAQAAGCTRCPLRCGATQVVFGQGDPQSRLMLVGEAPGADEDLQGIPFVGRAGQLLDRILDSVQIKRPEVYITNVVKCRPPQNRKPLKEEQEACRPHLQRQIELLNPAIIICLGATAAAALIDTAAPITAIRGRWFEKEGIRLMATFHPAALLRDPGKKRAVWEDIQKIRDVYRSL
jgi:uracil-DNA glycosylase